MGSARARIQLFTRNQKVLNFGPALTDQFNKNDRGHIMKKQKPTKVVARRERAAARKDLSPVHVSYIASLNDFSKLTREAQIVQASSTGLLIHVYRDDLIAPQLRKNLDLDSLVGERVYLRLDDMNLEISGIVARTKFLGKQGFHVAIDYTDEAPEYWRECLMDLLPIPGELE